MTYRHHSLRCHHRVQNTQGSNEYQLRITCQECQGHLAIVYGRQLNTESRLLIQEHLAMTAEPARGPVPPPPPPPVQQPQPRARAAGATPQPQDEPEPAERQRTWAAPPCATGSQWQHLNEEDVEVHRARVNLSICELNREIRRQLAELDNLPPQATPPPTAKSPPPPAKSPPPQAESPPATEPEEMSQDQERPRQ